MPSTPDKQSPSSARKYEKDKKSEKIQPMIDFEALYKSKEKQGKKSTDEKFEVSSARRDLSSSRPPSRQGRLDSFSLSLDSRSTTNISTANTLQPNGFVTKGVLFCNKHIIFLAHSCKEWPNFATILLPCEHNHDLLYQNHSFSLPAQ